MPGRAGQLDEISEAIGEIRGTLNAVEKYIHTREHGINNLSQKVEALGTKFSGDLAAAKAEISVGVTTAIEKVEARLQIIDERVTALETAQARDDGQRSVWVEILKSPIVAGTIGGILALLAVSLAYFKGVHPR